MFVPFFDFVNVDFCRFHIFRKSVLEILLLPVVQSQENREHYGESP